MSLNNYSNRFNKLMVYKLNLLIMFKMVKNRNCFELKKDLN